MIVFALLQMSDASQETAQPLQKRQFAWLGFGWRFALAVAIVGSNSASIHLHVYHFADSIEQMCAFFKKLLRLVGLSLPAVM